MSRDRQWSVRDNDLTTRRRSGGSWALKGFDFQRAYATVRLAELALCHDGLVAVRYEGAQDVDLMYSDGRELYVQLKDRPKDILDWGAALPILESFVHDDLTARVRQGSADVGYCLVTTSVPVGAELDQLVRGVGLRKHSRALALALAGTIKPAMDVTTEMLKRLKIEVRCGPNACADLVSLAEARLLRIGVQARHVGRAAEALGEALKPRREFSARDVLDLLRPYLSEQHPAAPGGAFRLLAPFIASASDAAIEQSFRAGGQSPWAAIAAGLDVRRDAVTILSESLGEAASLSLVSGAGGAGKTTLAHRVAWDLHTAGQAVAVEMVDPSADDGAWDELLELASATGRRVLVLIDDFFSHPQLADQLARRQLQDPVRVLATARPVPAKKMQSLRRSLAIPVTETTLTRLSDGEVARICASLGIAQPPEAELRSLRASGQILLLVMVLRNGSAEGFAASLLEPIQLHAPEQLDAYVDLCICSQFDQAIPAALVFRRHPSAVGMEAAAALQGLVFRRGTKDEFLRAGHALLADAVVRVSHIDPASRALELLGAVDPTAGLERRFAIKLLENLAESPARDALLARSAALEEAAGRLCAAADYLDLHRLARVFLSLGRAHVAEVYSTQAKATRLNSGPDAAHFMVDAIGEGRFAEAFPVLLEFYARSDTDYGRRNFIARSIARANAQQKGELLEITRVWLRSHGYPTAECKSTVDLLANWPGDGVSAHRDLLIEILRQTNVDPDIAAQAATVVLRLRDRSALDVLMRYGRALLDPAQVASNAVFALNLSRAAQSADEADRRRLANLFLGAVSASTIDVDRSRLLKAALHASPAEDLPENRRRALQLASQAQRTLREALLHIRADDGPASAGS